MRNVKFYSSMDLSVGSYLKKIEDIYSQFQRDQRYTLNQIIELYNCSMYIDHGLYLETWDKAYIDEVNKAIKGYIARYFSKLEDIQILEGLKELQFNYKDDFLDLFFKYKLESRVSEEQIKKWIEDKLLNIYIICYNKKFVNIYQDITRELLLSDSLNAELIIGKHLKESTCEEKIYLPVISNERLNSILENYIDSLEVNLNYLDLLITARSNAEFNISGEVKLKAKKKSEQLREQYLKKEMGGLEFEHLVAFKRDLEAPMTADIKAEEGKFRIYYDKNWLEEELEYFTILYNFIWLFGYLDSNGRITLVNLQTEASALENALGITGRYEYKTNYSFGSKEIFSQMKLTMYYELLESKEVELERVLEWYFNSYIKEEFLVDNYILELPSKYATYKEKCLVIFAEIENVLNQFDSYVKYKYINQELIEINSHSVLFSQVPSLLKDKYIYAKQESKNIMHHLFSDQAGLSYIDEHLNARSFYELISLNDLQFEQFHNYQQMLLQQLLEQKYISRDAEGYIRWENPYKIHLLRDLYMNEVIIYHRLNPPFQTEINKMIDDELVETKSTLFSELEQDYFDYYLNNHKFQNGLQLRNKYMHGKRVMLSENQHKQNYLIGLKLLICIVLKINEEFCIGVDFDYE